MLDRAKSPEERRKVKRDERRLSDADRTDASRRLEAHGAMGHLQDDEVRKRVEVVEASTMPAEVAKLFADLPALTERPPSLERRVSTQDREDATRLLAKAFGEGRIYEEEYEVAKERVREARTRSEIDAVFHGLPTPGQVAVGEKASSAAKQTADLGSHVLAEGGRRAGKAFRRGVLAFGALMLGIILVIAGLGLGALVCFVGAVALFVSSAISLVSSAS